MLLLALRYTQGESETLEFGKSKKHQRQDYGRSPTALQHAPEARLRVSESAKARQGIFKLMALVGASSEGWQKDGPEMLRFSRYWLPVNVS